VTASVVWAGVSLVVLKLLGAKLPNQLLNRQSSAKSVPA
jgi:hypothetical protein